MYRTIRNLSRTLCVVLLLAAIVVAAAPGASAQKRPPLRSTETFTLDIYDSYLSTECGIEVVATLTATEQRTIFHGADEDAPASERTTYDGEITWIARGSGATYSDTLKSRLSIEYPQGIGLWKPAQVTVTGRNGGTFPIGGGPAGKGTLVYDATVYAEHEGFPYWFVSGDQVREHGTFDRTAKRICAALT